MNAAADDETHADPGDGRRPGLLPISSAREATGLVRSLLARRRWSAALCLLVFAIEGLAGLVAPWQLGRIVDAVLAGDRAAVVHAFVLMLAAAVIGGVAAATSIALLARVAEPALADLREQALDRAVHLDTAAVEAAGSGDLLSRVGDDVRLVAESITDVVPTMVNSALAVGFTAIGLFALDWRLGLAGLTAVPMYLAGLRWYLPRSAPRYREEREANGRRAEALLTGVHAAPTLRAYGLSEHQQEQVRATSWESTAISLDVYRLLTRFFGRNNRAELVGLLAILVTGFLLVRGEHTSVGAVTAAALFFHRLFNPIGALVGLFDEVQSAGASLTRLTGLALLPAAVRPSDDPPAHSGLDVRGVGHAYRPGRSALADVDLDLAPGERVAVVGATGAGKSTLGLIAAGRMRPTSGTVALGGRPLAGVADPRRLAVAMVSQEIHVFAGTVRDNLTLAAPDADDDLLEATLRATGAWPAVGALPEGLDTVVGDGALEVTATLAQQLALARILLADPHVAVLDEATAEAGSAGSRDLDRAALAVTEGRTTLTIAHRLTQARDADRVLVLDAGRVVEIGSHDDLLARGGRYARLWEAWTDRG